MQNPDLLQMGFRKISEIQPEFEEVMVVFPIPGPYQAFAAAILSRSLPGFEMKISFSQNSTFLIQEGLEEDGAEKDSLGTQTILRK